MLKQNRQIFEFVFVGCDLVVITAAWLLAYGLRFHTDLLPIEKGVPDFENYLYATIFVWPIWAVTFRRFGLYRAMRGVRRTRELWLLLNANIVSLVTFIAIVYLFREKSAPFSRSVFFCFGLLAIIFTALERGVLRFALRELRRRGYNLRYLLVVGAGQVASDIASRIRRNAELGVQLLGCLSKTGKEPRGPLDMPILGAYADLQKIVTSQSIDQVVVALPLEDNVLLPEVLRQVEGSLVDIRVVPDVYQFVSIGGAIEEFEGLPIISLQSSPISGINLVAKRAFDLLAGAGAILVATPLMLLIAVLVKLTSRGPVFYVQQRVSVDGTPFSILKFRTMRSDAESSGPGWTKPNDDRVTSLGKLLRGMSLDELPQLFNVIRGDISLVGPRPERPVFIEEFRKRIPKYMLRHKVPAGLTGWAQVNGWRGDTSIDKRIEYDLFYIQNWSLWLDFKILVLTMVKGFGGRNAY